MRTIKFYSVVLSVWSNPTVNVIRFDRIHERDGRTDGHRTTAKGALMHSIARQKLRRRFHDAKLTPQPTLQT